MKRLTLVLLGLLVASIAGADSWYSIDGFTVRTGPEVRIDAEHAGVEIIGFSVTGGSEPDVAGWLALAGGGPVSDADMVVLTALTMVRALQTDSGDVIESVEINSYTSPTGIEGQWMTVYSSTGWHDAFLVRIETPGEIFDSITLVPREGGGLGRDWLDQLLESLEITIEEAAG